jgi:hypothetical protein
LPPASLAGGFLGLVLEIIVVVVYASFAVLVIVWDRKA